MVEHWHDNDRFYFRADYAPNEELVRDPYPKADVDFVSGSAYSVGIWRPVTPFSTIYENAFVRQASEPIAS